MLNSTQNAFIVMLTVAASLVVMTVLNRLWPSEKRRAHNDLIGWQLGILGTTYAVIIGFMLYAVWANFGAAELNADAEANALLNLYRLAEGLPEQQKIEMRHLVQDYADSVVQVEWPAMTANKTSFHLNPQNQHMWVTIMSLKPVTPAEIATQNQVIQVLTDLNQYRRIRQLQSISHLPGVLWCVLLIGGVVTVGSACMFGSGSFTLHAVQVSAFALVISLVLVAIADIDRPFQGGVHVDDAAFRRALQTMAEY